MCTHSSSAIVVFFALLALVTSVNGFSGSRKSSPIAGVTKTSISRLNLSPVETTSTIIDALLQRVTPSEATKEFYFFFFGGSGALGIGAAQIPKILKSFDEVKKLVDSKVTEGGDNLDLNFVASLGLPVPLKTKDVEKVIKNFPAVSQILKNGPKTSYMAQQGYVEREGFMKSFPNCNPLTVYAAFEAVAAGGGDLVAPDAVESAAAAWKSGGIAAFKDALLVARAKKYSAYGIFVFLIALVLDLIVETGTNAFL